MKKLLAPITLLFLVACQPSELDRCIEANISTSNDYLDKEIELEKKLLATGGYDEGFTDEQNKLVQDWADSLNPVELIIDDCIAESKEESPNLEAEVDYIEDLKPRVKSCITASKDEIENLILEQKNTATSICNAQGIY